MGEVGGRKSCGNLRKIDHRGFEAGLRGYLLEVPRVRQRIVTIAGGERSVIGGEGRHAKYPIEKVSSGALPLFADLPPAPGLLQLLRLPLRQQ